MKKTALVVLVVMTVLAAASSIAWAKGGSSKGDDVCWVMNGSDHWAIFYETGSGIVHEWRYEPHDAHLIFKPQSKFPKKPQGDGWFQWAYREQYAECEEASDTYLDEIFPIFPEEKYWVRITGL